MSKPIGNTIAMLAGAARELERQLEKEAAAEQEVEREARAAAEQEVEREARAIEAFEALLVGDRR